MHVDHLSANKYHSVLTSATSGSNDWRGRKIPRVLEKTQQIPVFFCFKSQEKVVENRVNRDLMTLRIGTSS